MKWAPIKRQDLNLLTNKTEIEIMFRHFLPIDYYHLISNIQLMLLVIMYELCKSNIYFILTNISNYFSTTPGIIASIQ